MCRKVKSSLQKTIQKKYKNTLNGNVWVVMWRSFSILFFFPQFYALLSNAAILSIDCPWLNDSLTCDFSTLQLHESNIHLVETILWIFNYDLFPGSWYMVRYSVVMLGISSTSELPIRHIITRVNNHVVLINHPAFSHLIQEENSWNLYGNTKDCEYPKQS